MDTSGRDMLAKITSDLPSETVDLLAARDGAPLVINQLSQMYQPLDTLEGMAGQKAWDLSGLYYYTLGRYHESLSVYESLYDRMLEAQEAYGSRIHKGTPLCRMSDCYNAMGYRVIAKRYLMLTLCEDALTSAGRIDPNLTGIYFRLVWHHGLPDAELRRYAELAWNTAASAGSEFLYPEWLLQEMDQDWCTQIPTVAEASTYVMNSRYLRYLLSQIGEGTGKILERTADYLLACVPGCRTRKRDRSPSTDYDVVCSMDGVHADFRSELGRYFVCECKDWSKPADFTTMAKFCRVLDSVKCHFGILFSREGISGSETTENAAREQLKVYQDRGMVIVVVDAKDLHRVLEGESFITILRNKYEKVRLDLV